MGKFEPSSHKVEHSAVFNLYLNSCHSLVTQRKDESKPANTNGDVWDSIRLINWQYDKLSFVGANPSRISLSWVTAFLIPTLKFPKKKIRKSAKMK